MPFTSCRKRNEKGKNCCTIGGPISSYIYLFFFFFFNESAEVEWVHKTADVRFSERSQVQKKRVGFASLTRPFSDILDPVNS